MISVLSLDQFQKIVQQDQASLFYFSHEQCNVCKVLRPKIETELTRDYPRLKQYYCDIHLYPEISAQNSVFAVPTILIFFEGLEYLRFSRHISLEILHDKINRPYQLLFDND